MRDDWMTGLLNRRSAKSGLRLGGNPNIHLSIHKTGITLIELLVVMSVIAVLLTISLPTIASFLSPKHKLRKDARTLMNVLNEARWMAMNRKIRIDVRVDPVAHEVQVVEADLYRALAQKDPYGFLGVNEEAYALSISNRFEKVITFDEETMLEAFTAEDILEEDSEEGEDIFHEPGEDREYFQPLEEMNQPSIVAITFNHFGGSNGGGISIFRGNVHIDIACDMLTGRPKIVTRKKESLGVER